MQPKLDLPLSEDELETGSKDRASTALVAMKEELEKELEWSEGDVQKSIEVILGAETIDNPEEAMPPSVSLVSLRIRHKLTKHG